MDDSFENWLKERTPETDADDGRLSPGTAIGAYHVETFLGKGGFAEVYGAKTATGERVAIKILHRLDEQSRMRFERESNILSQIHHPNIPKLLSFGSCGNRPYLVMEMLEAKELPHSDKTAASFIKAVCRAADALHKMGYVHRDIKPSNVLWRGDTPVLIDFGLACLKTNVPRPPSTISIVDGQRIVVGTMGYAAPEQFAGGTIDEATDVHAIGMLADACFNGEPPKCWRKIIDRATNSRGRTRFPTALALARKVSLRHFGRRLTISLLVLACAYNLVGAHLGWSSVLYGIGACYKNGWCVPADATKAVRWFARAAKANTDFWLRIDPLTIKPQRSVAEILEGAKAGNVDDMVSAADLYREGASVETNYARSAELYRKAIGEGSFSALHGLGALYAEGKGVSCKPRSAFLLCLCAASHGVVAAQKQIAVYYEQGFGTERNREEANTWRNKSILRPIEKEWTELKNAGEDDFVIATKKEHVGMVKRCRCEGHTFEYGLNDDGSLSVLGGHRLPMDVIIPRIINGRRVTKIGKNAFSGMRNLTSVVISEGVRDIGSCAFARCVGLRDVTLPRSMATIGYGAFLGCTNLIPIVVGGGVTNIAPLSFHPVRPNVSECKNYMCDGEAIYSRNCSTLVAYYGTGSVYRTLPQTKRVKTAAFAQAHYLKQLILNDGLEELESRAVYGCHQIRMIELPATVCRLGSDVFSYCYQLDVVHYLGRKPEIVADVYKSRGWMLSVVGQGMGWECPSGCLPENWPERWINVNDIGMRNGESTYVSENMGYEICYGSGTNSLSWKQVLPLREKALSQCAVRGNATAKSVLGRMYSRGLDGVKQDRKLALQYLQGAASVGFVEDMLGVGGLYRSGVNGAPDYREAIKWYVRALGSGGRWSCLTCQALAGMYDSGQGVERDAEMVFLLYLIAASHGMAWSQCMVGDCFVKGHGTARNIREAKRWYQEANAWKRWEGKAEYREKLQGAVEYAERKLKELERINCESMAESCKMNADVCQ